jgi:penicillin-binding protein 2
VKTGSVNVSNHSKKATPQNMYKRNYASRKYVIIFIFIVVAILFFIKLYYLQVADNKYGNSANNLVLRTTTEYPMRGRIYDRNGKLIVYNDAVYDLMVIPRQVKNPDTAEFCKLLDVDTVFYKKRMKKAIHYSRYKPSIFIKQLSKEEYAKIEDKMYKFKGFFVQRRALRKYNRSVAGHLLGSVGEVNQRDLKRDNYYRSGDYIGKSGIERFYEKLLRGKKGSKIVQVDVHNRNKGSYQDGKYDTLAIPGKSIKLSIDAELQAYGEKLMQNKIGSIVIIEPSTGEILAMVSSPTYDLNLLVGRSRSKNYTRLRNDSLKPLMNRAVSGTYPPGSTFKMINALVALQEKAIVPSTKFTCKGKLSRPIKCTHNHKTPLALNEAIKQSCNPYFWNTFRDLMNKPSLGGVHKAFEKWYTDIKSFGFGKKFNTDIPFEVKGNIPSKEYYDKVYRGSWNALTVRSLAIGQGEILVTPIQLANLSAIIANKGFYYPPHFLKEAKGEDSLMISYGTKINTNVKSKYFDVVQHAMRDVFAMEHGTAHYYEIDSVNQCGKTGTVQNPHGEDHSMFIAFAPMEDPKIAISVIVENGGYGSKWAAPIASLLMEKYLLGEVKRKKLEERIINGDLIHQKH